MERSDEERKIRVSESEKRGDTKSTTGHVKPCGKKGGPPSKAKHSLVTDREEYREGKVKRTPGGE